MKKVITITLIISLILSCLIGCSEKIIAQTDSTNWKCENCGNKQNSGNFCTKCGTAKPATAWTCNICGKTNSLDDNFCANCGNPKGAKSQQDEAMETQKDDSAMGEVANAIMLGLSDQKIYDEVLYSTAKGNVSCYIDAVVEASLTDSQKFTKVVTKQAGTGDENKEQYLYGDDCRMKDEMEYYFAGNMRGMTITFIPQDGKVTVGKAIINAGLTPGFKVASDRAASRITYYGGAEWTGRSLSELSSNSTNEGKNYLYNRVRATVGDTITLCSIKYCNSSYTVFIRMGSTGGNSAAGQDAVTVYGQWNGTNLK